MASAERDTAVAAQDLVVTGSRAAKPALERVRGGAETPPIGAYRAFLSHLQTAVRGNDRRAILKLIAFPLRVNAGGASRLYRSRQEVERDFDSIFTPKVRQAILEQRADRLFIRDLGAMIGDGELWFDQTCVDAECWSPGPVRIKAVNP